MKTGRANKTGAHKRGVKSHSEARKLCARFLALSAKHPRFKRPYTECVYQPMIELMQYLRANQFKTYIATGGVHHDDAKREQAYGAEAIKLCNGIVIMTGL